MCGSDIFLAILAIFFPPIAVWVKVGIFTADSVINIALCCLCYAPGLLHAWYIILKNPEPDYDNPNYAPIPGGAQPGDVEGNRVTYYYVSRRPLQHPSQRGYGTVDSHPQQYQQPPLANQPPYHQAQTQQNEEVPGSSSQAQDSRPPPTYAEAIRGDYKIQTQD